eukprot:CAMPEP_0205809202 /NCGR_PEP_ID=MMETSP0205-20121125/13332_1 /ASSEMBLY_ACC=CAM_ASM_000278 /TAXON_ID=36767 /ORGANISM="Euplotes focardii, Strain TN1" /LENGTH=254 /DNA_ID=CAMNT_0053085997 /DNA_START=361 /DNA_END=1125 /DNA_ORIENTATION=+
MIKIERQISHDQNSGDNEESKSNDLMGDINRLSEGINHEAEGESNHESEGESNHESEGESNSKGEEVKLFGLENTNIQNRSNIKKEDEKNPENLVSQEEDNKMDTLKVDKTQSDSLLINDTNSRKEFKNDFSADPNPKLILPNEPKEDTKIDYEVNKEESDKEFKDKKSLENSVKTLKDNESDYFEESKTELESQVQEKRKSIELIIEGNNSQINDNTHVLNNGEKSNSKNRDSKEDKSKNLIDNILNTDSRSN